jgi:hypothetical protein
LGFAGCQDEYTCPELTLSPERDDEAIVTLVRISLTTDPDCVEDCAQMGTIVDMSESAFPRCYEAGAFDPQAETAYRLEVNANFDGENGPVFYRGQLYDPSWVEAFGLPEGSQVAELTNARLPDIELTPVTDGSL